MQRWIGVLKYEDSILIQVKYFVHALTRHMCFPPPEAISLLRTLTVYALSVADVGITFGGDMVTRSLDMEVHMHKAPDMKDAPPHGFYGTYDASHMSPPVKSILVYAVQFFGGPLSVAVLNIPVVMPSSFTAELWAAVALCAKLAWLREALAEMGVVFSHPTPAYGDNSSVITMSRPGAVPSRSKAEARRVGAMQEYVRNKVIAPLKIHTDLNHVDYLSKPVAAAKFEKSVRYITNSTRSVPPDVTVAAMVDVAVEMLAT